jgi:hypothetical protein
MSYAIRSEMLADLTPTSPRLLRHPHLCRLWRWISWLLLLVAYAGALIAPAGVLSIPFQFFHKHHFAPYAFWITSGLVGLLAAWWFYKASACAVGWFRQRVIHLEALVFSMGLVLAVFVVVWLFPPN